MSRSASSEEKWELVSKRGSSRRAGRGGEKQAVFNVTGDPMKWLFRGPRPNQVFRMTSTQANIAAFSSSASVEVDYGSNFTLSALSDVTNLTSTFDQYRIERIELMVYPRITTVTSNTANVGIWASAVDYDNSAATTFANLITFDNAIVGSGLMGRYHTWIPHVAILTGAAGGSSGVATTNVPSPWLDSATTSTPHYGFKMSSNGSTDVVYTFDWIARYHLAFRNKI